MSSPNSNSLPLVSFVVASYNYDRFIRTTIESILNQSMRDVEAIVVDDASTDSSRDVVRSFTDPRVRLVLNDKNMGPCWTLNRGAGLARGKYISYLDSDDWIEFSEKTERQLEYLRQNPRTDIVGTYARICGLDGTRHPQADELESQFNQPRDFNELKNWVIQNNIFAPSVLIPRVVHDRIGFRDLTMKYAADYELWTRAHRMGCRFGMVPSPLLFYRLHDDSVSRRSSVSNFLELLYVHHKNILPLIETPATLPLMGTFFNWLMTHDHFSLLNEAERYRLLALMLTPTPISSFGEFDKARSSDLDDPELIELGRRCFAAGFYHPAREYSAKLLRDINEYIGARDALHRTCLEWQQHCDALHKACLGWQQHYRELEESGGKQREELSAQIAKLKRETGAQLETIEQQQSQIAALQIKWPRLKKSVRALPVIGPLVSRVSQLAKGRRRAM